METRHPPEPPGAGDDEFPKRFNYYIPFITVLNASRIKPTVMNQKAFTVTKGIVINCATTAMRAIITEINQKFFVGAFSLMILPSIVMTRNEY